MNFTREETGLLVQDGYEPGFLMDIQEGDLVAIPPVTRSNFDGSIAPIKSLVVKRMMKIDASYSDPETGEFTRNIVIKFIGIDLDGLPVHCSYGSTYPCFYKRSE